MRIAGQRSDGALYVTVTGHLAVLLKGDRVTAPLDQTVVEGLGPWAPGDNSWENRRRVQAKLDLAKVWPVAHFALGGLSFDQTRNRVLAALRTRYGLSASPYQQYAYPTGVGGMDLYIPENGLGEDWVVYCLNGKHFGLAYEMDDEGLVTFEGDPVDVTATWTSMGDENTPFDDAVDLSADAQTTPFAARFVTELHKQQTLRRARAVR